MRDGPANEGIGRERSPRMCGEVTALCRTVEKPCCSSIRVGSGCNSIVRLNLIEMMYVCISYAWNIPLASALRTMADLDDLKAQMMKVRRALLPTAHQHSAVAGLVRHSAL